MTDAYSVRQILDNRIAQTPPIGDSSNRIITSKFITQGISITPAIGTTQGLGILQTGSGSIATSGFSYDFISVGDNLSAAGNTVDGFAVFVGLTGSAVDSARQAFQSTIQLQAPTSATNANRSYVAGVFVAQALSNDGGGSGSEKGAIFAINPVATLSSTAAHMAECSGGEVDMSWAAGASGLDKYGWKVVQEATDKVAGSRNDAAFFAANQTGAIGWGTLFQIGDGLNASPLATTGTVMATKGTPTVANGIDLSGATVTGSAFKSPGSYSVDGSGNIISGGNITVNGVVTLANATNPPAGGSTGLGLRMSATANLGLFFGSGLPTLAAATGSLYIRIDGSSATTRLYSNLNGATSWTSMVASG